jgi:hypothetical protein
MADLLGMLGLFARTGLLAQNANSYLEKKRACIGDGTSGRRMGVGGFFTGPQCYEKDGTLVVDLYKSGGSKKNRKVRRTKKRKIRSSRKRKSRAYRK